MTVEIIEWNEISSWSWDLLEDTCCFCQSTLDYCCPCCIFPGEQCPPVVGECGHTFHKHCIDTWLEKNTNCPVCRQQWKNQNLMEIEN
ncbi:zinc finger domain containing protein [Entamoeba histolytica HM-1:IMSS-B]|uniref:Anaphase-promoting complex subunit 11 n=8 Tax=Entamoeba TaxID=5758 RepID=C4M0Z6_ENTH1|nr:zinc finger domain containing protein [Entamoeba nuttalli P19]XP_651657.1 zinc finger domain containing protein [Entamoeba histolytica HM-1:IMSS]EMD48608.1 zinc finger domain containing protein [Entamoeba histolytica KU27]EMH72784.1 zinc finger domain containing protein [Entamoeba histolytica HM-1:IMSS-B]EMS14500.1 zinc finger domain containing protein [Entamoeba histolytica HM-3:IMSS]ENY61033.1 zinc finger domain containing protein [Entamoeba histolytica HM-1:IMSS-A]GAT94854.1 zinc finger|eukprot:XP_008856719.1 zinc finger domain containing protein [Entamoeba nuttalli P19]